MSSPKPYQIAVPQAKIDRLQQKLSLVDFPDELAESGWDLGCPLQEVKRLTQVWKEWNWRDAEKRLNRYHLFTIDIHVGGFGDLNIHFLHQQSEVQNAIPLLFIHGWPGSFIEVLPILSEITSSEHAPSFHVVAPSLPNFGFSQGPSKRGFALPQYAETLHRLMLSLGYEQYVTQSGDWGMWIARAMAKFYPESCRASHINMPYTLPPTWTKHPIVKAWDVVKPLSGKEKQRQQRTDWFSEESTGYNKLQSTRPQTIAYALTDSPVAVLAWIYEKLHDWTDDYDWTDDEILTWVSIYTFSVAGPGAAGRIYYEVAHSSWEDSFKGVLQWNGQVKVGLTYSPKELEMYPTNWAHTLGPIAFMSEKEHGGHFYATEHPPWLIEDLRKMFGKGGGAYGVVDGKDGIDRGRSRLADLL